MQRDAQRLKALAVAAVRRVRNPRRGTSIFEKGASQRVSAGLVAWFRLPILTLSMLLSTVCNVRINLRSMVRRTAVITLAGKAERRARAMGISLRRPCRIARRRCSE